MVWTGDFDRAGLPGVPGTSVALDCGVRTSPVLPARHCKCAPPHSTANVAPTRHCKCTLPHTRRIECAPNTALQK
eukprot:50831-Chlamydomonas_euryale.AAC.2